jgi:hypothetical protein
LVFWDQGINSFVPLTPVIRNPSITTFTVTQATHGLLTGTLYSFKIQAINDVGASLFSETLEDEMPAIVPTPPLNLRLVTSTASSIFIEWFDPLSNGGTQVKDYQVFFAEESSSDFELLASTTLGMNSYLQQSDLIPGDYYLFKVVAINHIGVSPASRIIRVVAAGAPDAPVNLMRVNSTLTSVTFTW